MSRVYLHDLHRQASPDAPSASGRSTLRRIGNWVVCALVFVLTLEACVRIGDWLRWGAPLRGEYSNDILFTADSIGWRPKPGARYQKWAINGFGFRGPEISREPPEGVSRIVVMGSSETFGQQESPDHEFPRLLERYLNQQSGGAFEVINAGIPGMSVARMTDYWTRWVRQFSPSVVIVYPSPSFYLGIDAPPLEPTPVGPYPAPATETFRLKQDIRQVLDRIIPPELQTGFRRLQTYRTVRGHPTDWVWTEVPPDRLQRYRDDARSFVETLRTEGVGVILATHAHAISYPLDEQDRLLLSGWRRFYPRALPDVIVEFEARANDALQDIGRELDVHVVRLDDAVPAEPGLFSDNQHFSDEGAERVARALVDAVTSLDSHRVRLDAARAISESTADTVLATK